MTTTAEPQALSGLAAIPTNQIHPSPNNPRERLTDIEGLGQSIRENGLIQPIIVQRIPGKPGYQIVAGHRRYAAVRKLGWTKVPAIIRRDMLPDEELLAMLVENGQRAGLDPIEEARALNRLKHQLGVSDAQIATKVGYSQAKVSMRLALLSLAPEDQEAVRVGETTLRAATDRARITSGRAKPGAKGKTGPAHLAAHHPLANRASACCRSLGHKVNSPKSVGGVACGACWESVIRANEREQLHTLSNTRGRCVLCDVPHDRVAVTEEEHAQMPPGLAEHDAGDTGLQRVR